MRRPKASKTASAKPPVSRPAQIRTAPTRWRLPSATLREFSTIGLIALGLYLCFLLAIPFLSSLTWAAALGVILLPLHRRLENLVVRPNLAAAAAVILTAIVSLGVVFFVAQQLVREVADGAVLLESAIRGAEWRDILADYPRLGGLVAWINARLDIAGLASGVAGWLTEQSTAFLRGSATQLVNLAVTFYLLFYFFRDRRRILEATLDLSPLSEDETREVIGRFTSTIDATIFGAVTVAAVQGTLSGLMFWWLGLPLPVTWGIVMGVLALLPVLGAAIVWVPAAAYLALTGQWFEAIVLTLWGGLVVSTIDNLIYPMLVGNRLKLHTVPALIGALGGLLLFGASGLVLGPATIAVTLALINIMKRRGAASAEAASAQDAQDKP